MTSSGDTKQLTVTAAQIMAPFYKLQMSVYCALLVYKARFGSLQTPLIKTYAIIFLRCSPCPLLLMALAKLGLDSIYFTLEHSLCPLKYIFICTVNAAVYHMPRGISSLPILYSSIVSLVLQCNLACLNLTPFVTSL